MGTTETKPSPFTAEERSVIEKQIATFADYYSHRQCDDLSDDQREEYDLMLAMTGALATIDARTADVAIWKQQAELQNVDRKAAEAKLAEAEAKVCETIADAIEAMNGQARDCGCSERIKAEFMKDRTCS